jgi:hypothetical protein
MEAKPVMVFPKSRMFFKCRAEHMWKRGQTILA